MTRDVLGYIFNFVTRIEVERDAAGSVREFMPQSRYVNKRGLRLNKHGAGPFCQFRIPGYLGYQGVYAVMTDGEISYIGECENLSERFNARGYGTIHPRNCFERGQPTNCKVNNVILGNAKEGRNMELWFYQTPHRKGIEAELIRRLQPRWNSQLKW